MDNTQVAILGGGLAGLNAARLLHRTGIDFHLFEARDRLGGRILTVSDAGQPDDDGFDLGPSWFWPHMQPAMAALVAELGLSSFPQCGGGDVIFERMSREPPHRLSGIGQDPYSMRITGGTGAMIRVMADKLPGDRLHLGARATDLALRGDGVEVTIRLPDGGTRAIMAKHVIAALPPRILAEAVRFAPDIGGPTRQAWQAVPTWMAPHAKFFALYDRPFWREQGLCGSAQSMVGPMPEIHDATTASGRAALFGFLGVDAQQRKRMSEAELTAACIAQFARMFGAEAENPRVVLYKDWAADPLTAAQADLDSTGHPSGTDPQVRGPWQQHLLLAGSESSPSEAGYLAGAVAASERAAAMLIDRER